MRREVEKSEEGWKRVLTPEEFRILRKGGTEPPLTGRYLQNEARGVYVCAGCGSELFSSGAKFDSGSGWPSFWQPISPESVEKRLEGGTFLRRTEVLCPKCGGHLGHVFDDGPQPTGKRYCINSAALHFKKGRRKEGTGLDPDAPVEAGTEEG